MNSGRPRLLILTTVHHADDTRIREKTLGSLVDDFDIVYASPVPAPAEEDGFTWTPLSGGRVRRNVKAWRLVLTGRFDLISLHDPELIPLGFLMGRRVVFDLHEDLPAQLSTKDWLPRFARRPVAMVATWLLRRLGRRAVVTIAEPSYQYLLDGPAPVVPNLPLFGGLPPTESAYERRAIYVGDVTEARGVDLAVVACGQVGVNLLIVGRCRDQLVVRLRRLASESGTELTLAGRLPHPEAMRLVAGSAVGLSPLRDLPNYRHSLPTKVLEYLAMGIPVVASDLPATREAIGDYEAIELFAPGDSQALAHALSRCLDPTVRDCAQAQAQTVRERSRFPVGMVRDLYLTAAGRRAETRPPN